MNQYDPNQPPQQTPYPPYQQPQQQQGYQQSYQQQPLPSSLSRNPLQALGDRLGVSVGVILAAGFLLAMCFLCSCVTFLVFLAGGRVPPPTPPPTAFPTIPSAFLTLTPIFPGGTPTPTFDPSAVGRAVNPYETAQLGLASAVYIDVLNAQTNQFERKAQIFPGSAEFETAMTALNVGNAVTAPDTACIDRVRIEIPRSDGVTIRMGVCLKDWGVIRSADIAELGGGDLGMYPLFTDLLAPYLPADYRNLLD
ncbi:MAG: hypothetical protein KF726_00920 [Anaerolineae bacterium]|nr:hypothetical protein [Anaerolineae bacterium]